MIHRGFTHFTFKDFNKIKGIYEPVYTSYNCQSFVELGSNISICGDVWVPSAFGYITIDFFTNNAIMCGLTFVNGPYVVNFDSDILQKQFSVKVETWNVALKRFLDENNLAFTNFPLPRHSKNKIREQMIKKI